MNIRIPPAWLRKRVSGTENLEGYLVIGSRSATMINLVLAKNGFRLGDFEKVLDFACGCGRTLTFLTNYTSSERLFGTDYDSEQVSRCSRNLSVGGCFVNNVLPPTAFPDSYFDLIYSISFLTHLSENAQKEWLEEWRRILKPNGVILVTTHGLGLAREQAIRSSKKGFAHAIRGKDFNQHVTYQNFEYIQREWAKYFTVLFFEERGLNDHQDVILLGKGKSSELRAALPVLSLPEELVSEYRNRPDLRLHFDENGIGLPHSSWRNLTLSDWALFNGGVEVDRLAHLSFEAMYQVDEAN